MREEAIFSGALTPLHLASPSHTDPNQATSAPAHPTPPSTPRPPVQSQW
jgi:hypothetical protein